MPRVKPGKTELEAFLQDRCDTFDVDQMLKCHLSSTYLDDANDFLWRIKAIETEAAKSDLYNRTYRAKTFVDMLMATECALKSIMLSMSAKSESPEKAYKQARRLSHDLHGLGTDSAIRCKGKVAFLTEKELIYLKQADKLGVRTRYGVDVFAMLQLCRRKVNTTLANHIWAQNFYTIMLKIITAARSAKERKCINHQLLVGNQTTLFDQRKKLFLEASGIKAAHTSSN